MNRVFRLPPLPALVAALALALILAAAGVASAQGHDAHDAAPPAVGEGRGDYEMVLIHTLGSKAAVWDGIKPYLMGSFKVATFELAGHGDTQPIADPTIAKEVARLGAFLKEIDYPYPVLVGHGLGGMIALQYTLENPGAVHRLILMDSAPMQLASAEEKAQVARQLVDNYDAFVAERFLNMTPDRDITNDIVDTALRTDQPTFTSLLLSSFDFDVTAQLRKLTVPLLVVGSQLMFPTPESATPLLDEYGFTHARSLSFKRIEHCGHFMMLERTVYTASVLLAFGAVGDQHLR